MRRVYAFVLITLLAIVLPQNLGAQVNPQIDTARNEGPQVRGLEYHKEEPDSVKKFAPEDMIYSNPWNKYAAQAGQAAEPSQQADSGTQSSRSQSAPTAGNPSDTAEQQTVRRRVRHHYASDGDDASDDETYIGKRHRY